jgi:hypothetical protein
VYFSQFILISQRNYYGLKAKADISGFIFHVWPQLRQRKAERTHGHRTHGGVADCRRLGASNPIQPPKHQTESSRAPSASPIRTLEDPGFRLTSPPGRGIRIHAAGAGRRPLLGRDLRVDSGERRLRPGRCAALPHRRRRRRHGRVRRGWCYLSQARR